MSKFVLFDTGAHFSYTSELGPNERFGIESEDSFQKLALKLEEKKELTIKL